MKSLKRAARWKNWLGIMAFSLGIHYLMLILCSVLLDRLSFSGLWDLAVTRLTEPGDATRYLDIAENGYTVTGENAINLVFFPLYPYLVRALGWIVGSLPLSGVLISQVCYAAASVVLYELILLDGDKRNAWDGVILLALYPFSVFVMGVFSEGLFLLLSLLCLYGLRTRRFVWAGIAGFLAALCRIQGMLLLLPAAYELITLRLGEEKRRFRWGDLALLLIPAGFCVYLGVNYALHGNCFQFLLYEADAPWYQSTRWIGENLKQHYELAQQYPGLAEIIYWPQIILFFAVLAVLLHGLWKRERGSYILYGGAYLGFTYLSGWMISGGRYMLCCVPVYIVLSKVKDGFARKLLIFIMTLLCFAYSLFFYRAHAIM